MGLGNILGALESAVAGGQGQQGNLAAALSHAFQSDQTPPFGEMIGNLFNQSSDEQKAGIINHLLQSVNPEMLQSGEFGNLAVLLGGTAQITPEQASQVDASAVQQIADHAQQNNPSIIETASHFYSQHPTLVNGIGAAALGLIMSHMSKK